jgi:hypothetical protein
MLQRTTKKFRQNWHTNGVPLRSADYSCGWGPLGSKNILLGWRWRSAVKLRTVRYCPIKAYRYSKSQKYAVFWSSEALLYDWNCFFRFTDTGKVLGTKKPVFFCNFLWRPSYRFLRMSKSVCALLPIQRSLFVLSWMVRICKMIRHLNRFLSMQQKAGAF